MIPSSWVFMDSLPRTANGKLDRSALSLVQPRTPRPADTPQGELETTVSSIVADVLQGTEVGRDTNFFEIGCNSLHVVRIHRRLCERLAREFEVVELFRRPTVARIAAWLSGVDDDAGASHEGKARAQARRAARSGRRSAETGS
jgi:hypothetical protein